MFLLWCFSFTAWPYSRLFFETQSHYYGCLLPQTTSHNIRGIILQEYFSDREVSGLQSGDTGCQIAHHFWIWGEVVWRFYFTYVFLANHIMENIFPYVGQGNGSNNSHTLLKSKHEIGLILFSFISLDDSNKKSACKKKLKSQIHFESLLLNLFKEWWVWASKISVSGSLSCGAQDGFERVGGAGENRGWT